MNANKKLNNHLMKESADCIAVFCQTQITIFLHKNGTKELRNMTTASNLI